MYSSLYVLLIKHYTTLHYTGTTQNYTTLHGTTLHYKNQKTIDVKELGRELNAEITAELVATKTKKTAPEPRRSYAAGLGPSTAAEKIGVRHLPHNNKQQLLTTAHTPSIQYTCRAYNTHAEHTNTHRAYNIHTEHTQCTIPLIAGNHFSCDF